MQKEQGTRPKDDAGPGIKERHEWIEDRRKPWNLAATLKPIYSDNATVSDLHGPWNFQFDEAITDLALDRQYCDNKKRNSISNLEIRSKWPNRHGLSIKLNRLTAPLT
jgi:hypothetical protein